jgi:hypothetical protein
MTIGRAFICGAAIAALVGGGVADAATRKPVHKPVRHTQTLTFTYTASQSAHTLLGPGGQLCASAGAAPQLKPCWDVAPASWAKYMTIDSKDQSGQLSLWGAGTGVNANGTETFVCSKAKNMLVGKGDAWSLSVDMVSVETTCPGPATTGTVTVTLSNLP